MKSSSDLRSMLKNIDRKGYPAYKGTYGIYDLEIIIYRSIMYRGILLHHHRN